MEMGTNSGGAAHQVNSRWNPTKEQISMLESMYRQGIRTPTADQIQQITSRLKDFGNIEGKNVFYWFQNHKARQRQKQKQENLAYISRYLHNKSHQPMFAPPTPNAVSGSYYLRQSELGFYPQYPDVLLPSDGLKRRQRTDQKTEKATTYAFTGNRSSLPLNCNSVVVQTNCRNQETLPLFPLHPTGNLQEKEVTVFSLGSNNSTEESINTTTPSSSSETTIGVDEASTDKPFFDFFSGQVPFETT